MAQQYQNRLMSMITWVLSLAMLSQLSIWPCCDLWCMSQMRVRSHVAVAVVQTGSCLSDQTPSLGTSICHRCGPKTNKNTMEQLKTIVQIVYSSALELSHLQDSLLDENSCCKIIYLCSVISMLGIFKCADVKIYFYT